MKTVKLYEYEHYYFEGEGWLVFSDGEELEN
jgi:glutamine cyclotransferase